MAVASRTVHSLRPIARAATPCSAKQLNTRILTNLSRRYYATQPAAQESSTSPVVKRHNIFQRITLKGRHPILRLIWSGVASVGIAGFLVVGGLLLYDATTYSDRHIDRVPVNPLSITPKRGGKKNLPIAEFLVDDEETEEAKALCDKPKLVLIGAGWGNNATLKSLTPGAYHVTIVAPDNYNLFTPLLPSATVGTVELRSLVEPIRKLCARVHGHYLQGRAVDIDMSERLIEIEGDSGNFYLPYDKVIISCGSVTNNHGVPGLQHAYQLKTVPDVMGIRRRIMDNLEKAALPTTSEEERKQLMSFVVCGGGPTGVEFASELYDMINEDVLKYFPKLLRTDATVHIIQSRDHILNTYAEKISEYAEQRFLHTGIDTILNARVKEIKEDSVEYTTKQDGKTVTHSIPAGFVLWSTGIAMSPFTVQVASLLPNQYHKHALEVDAHLRVKGAPLGTVYAIGDASTVETNLVDHLFEFVDEVDVDKNGKIDHKEFESILKLINRKFPTAQIHVEKVRDIFDEYDKDKSGFISLNELAEMFQTLSQKMTSLPATAQVASQQGAYLGKKLSKVQQSGHHLLDENDVHDDIDDMLYDPFTYFHLGSLAYIGNSAVFDLSGYSFAGGLIAMYAWRSVYWSEQVSFRTRLLLMIDWIKRGVFGRDLSRVGLPYVSESAQLMYSIAVLIQQK